MRAAFLLPLLIGAVPAQAQQAPSPASPLPAELQAMLDAAIASGSEGEIGTVAKYIKVARPQAGAAVDAAVSQWRARRTAQQAARIASAGVFDLWKGRAELGGYITTGNTNDIGVSGAIDIQRETRRWRHKLRLAADYQQSAGLTSRDHLLLAYEPNFKFSDRGYVYGAAQYESDHYLGYDQRYSASLGGGYSAVRSSAVSLNLELGPAYRSTDFIDGTTERSFAARGSIDFDWKLTPAISLSQDASAYLQHYNSTVSSISALNAKLIGPLAAKLSYAVQHESMPPLGRVGTDTTSRASLVYSF